MDLTGRQKRYLRGLAHHLKPLVTVGKQGVTEEVLAQVEANLEAHELIKVKVLQTAPETPGDSGEAICEHTGANLAQRVGRTLVLYRPREDDPEILLPTGGNG